ncbi:MAG TPA: thioredoxin fold domain-containing protein, partial [Gammaproteobacteria bacterium]|nr:thioredoxin fold domain-containing protein [Gammaproteobacteria bacterium]
MRRAVVGWFLVLLCWGAAWAAEGPAQGPDLDAPGYHEQPSWFKVSFLDIRDDVREATSAGKRVVLYFYQDGCPYCKKLLETNLSQQDIVARMRKNFDVVSINMWGDREVTDLDGKVVTEKQFAERRRVMFTPTLLFLDEQGRVVLRMNGYYPPHKFMTVLDYVAGHLEDKLSYRDYYAKVDPEPAKGVLHREPGYMDPPYRLDARSGDRPLLVLFEQKDCPPCDELHLDILKRPESRKLMRHFDVVLLDMWSDTPVRTPDGRSIDAASWARALKIQYAPSMVFFDGSGKEVFRAEGYLRAFHTQSVLDYVASGAYRSQPSF